jgi:hypothetical protein
LTLVWICLLQSEPLLKLPAAAGAEESKQKRFKCRKLALRWQIKQKEHVTFNLIHNSEPAARCLLLPCPPSRAKVDRTERDVRGSLREGKDFLIRLSILAIEPERREGMSKEERRQRCGGGDWRETERDSETCPQRIFSTF